MDLKSEISASVLTRSGSEHKFAFLLIYVRSQRKKRLSSFQQLLRVLFNSAKQ